MTSRLLVCLVIHLSAPASQRIPHPPVRLERPPVSRPANLSELGYPVLQLSLKFLACPRLLLQLILKFFARLRLVLQLRLKFLDCPSPLRQLRLKFCSCLRLLL